MAWLEAHPTSGHFKICFRFNGRKLKKTVKTAERLTWCAPVKDPFSWPNNSLSSKAACKAAQLMITKAGRVAGCCGARHGRPVPCRCHFHRGSTRWRRSGRPFGVTARPSASPARYRSSDSRESKPQGKLRIESLGELKETFSFNPDCEFALLVRGARKGEMEIDTKVINELQKLLHKAVGNRGGDDY